MSNSKESAPDATHRSIHAWLCAAVADRSTSPNGLYITVTDRPAIAGNRRLPTPSLGLNIGRAGKPPKRRCSAVPGGPSTTTTRCRHSNPCMAVSSTSTALVHHADVPSLNAADDGPETWAYMSSAVALNCRSNGERTVNRSGHHRPCQYVLSTGDISPGGRHSGSTDSGRDQLDPSGATSTAVGD